MGAAPAVVDVFDEGREVVIITELPGAREEEITVEIRGDVLTIESHGERHYAKEVLLPSAIDGKSVQRKYNNGVLEIRARKVRARGSKGPAAPSSNEGSPDGGDPERGAEGKRSKTASRRKDSISTRSLPARSRGNSRRAGSASVVTLCIRSTIGGSRRSSAILPTSNMRTAGAT